MSVVNANLVQRILNAHVSFARAGVTLNSTASGASAKPGISPSAWPYLGQPGQANIEPQQTFTDVIKACPGRRRLVDRKMSFNGTDIVMTFDEIQKLTFEMFYGASGAITDDYVPLAGTTPFKTWLKFQTYDENDNLIDTSDLWCHVQPDGALSLGGEALTTFSLRATVLASAYNSGTLSTLAA